ncbi:MAG TPA: DUF928 domain-containing protein [Oscillatoriales cyanobacterium M59_W2019_021]|nr:DUF928 domain-containing protein [Oscillatoriales cyanobacterium M4454_W2019_049]HIK50755.1 DUF928 domain-containing protein [Oscillatoriales cyanobacterium M59_W2019_021]
MNFSQSFKSLAIAFALASLANLVATFSVRAESTLRYSPPPPPEDRGTPTGRSRGGASRDPLCGISGEPLTALVPSTPGERLLEIVWARTVADRPTFWFYVPYNLAPNLPVEFILEDDGNNVLYQSKFEVESSPGIVRFTLPDSVDPLELDRLYRWSFKVYCHPTSPVFVRGWVERITLESELQGELETATPREQIALFAANGIWYDAIANLAALRHSQPEDTELLADWNSLLESVGLQEIASEPIVECCTPAPSP